MCGPYSGADAAADQRQVQAGYTRGIREVHDPRVGLDVPVLQISRSAGFQSFQGGACPAPDVRAEAFLGLAFVAELKGAQFAVDEPQTVDVAAAEGSAVEDEIEEVIPGARGAKPSQSREMLRKRKPYTGCNAGITHFHADPHRKASICKVGRDPQVDLIAEGADGLRRLAAAADALLTRHGGCTGCTLQKTCGTGMPLASLYRQAKAPLEVFCQHGPR
jgi:hypothetical protein